MDELKELFLVFEEELNIHIALIGTHRIKLNGTYVTDINQQDYHVRFKEIKTWIQENVEISEDNLKILQNLNIKIKEVERRLETIPKSIKGLFEFIDTMEAVVPYELPMNKPEIFSDENIDKSYFILDAIKDFYKINEQEDPDLIGQEELNNYLINNTEINLSPEDLPMIYSFGHMSYVLQINKEFLSRLTNCLEEWLSNFPFPEGKTIEQKEDIDLNPNALYFNLSKKELAALFHTFHELNLLTADKLSFNKSDTTLRQVLDKSNYYYLYRNKTYMPIIDIGKSFDVLYKAGKYSTKSVNKDEIQFLNKLINKLQERLLLLESKRK